MARGNQRDKAREKNQKEAAAQVGPATLCFALHPRPSCFSASSLAALTDRQKKKNNVCHIAITALSYTAHPR